MAIKKKTIKELEAEWDSNPKWKTNKTTKELEAEWDNGSQQRNAEFAGKDYNIITGNLPNYSTSFYDSQYKMGGSADIKNSAVIPKFETYGKYAPIISNNLAAGVDYLGMTDEELAEYQKALLDAEKEAMRDYNLATARTGGLASIDTTGMKRKTVHELGRMDKLSQYDEILERQKQFSSRDEAEAAGVDIYGGMSEKEYMDWYTAHLREQQREKMAGAEAKRFEDQANELAASVQGDGKYVQGKDYWRTLDRGLLNSGLNEFNIDGEVLSYDEYLQKAEKSYINDYMGAVLNDDEDAIIELMDVGSAFPELQRRFSVDALAYADKDQAKTAINFINNDDMEGLYNFLGKIDYDISKDMVTEWNENATEWANESVGSQILGTIASFPLNLVGGVYGAADTVSGLLENFDWYKNMVGEDVHSQANAGRVLAGFSDIYRGEMGQTIADATPFLNFGNGKNLANTAFQGLASLGDSLLSMAGGPMLQAVSMFGQEAGRTLYEQQDKGNDNAAIYATGVGVISAAMEKFGLDSLFTGNLKKAVLGNAAEEGLTEIASSIYDIIVNGNNSEYNTLVDQYRIYGYGDKAGFKAALDKALDTAEAALGGMFAGFAGGAPDAISARNEGKNIRTNEGVEALANLADTVPVSKDVKAIVARMKAEVAESKKGAKGETAIDDTAAVTKEDAAAEARETEMAERDRNARAEETKDAIEEDAASVTKEDADAMVREAEMAERDRGERAEETKGAIEEDAAAVTKEDADAMVRKADQIARDLNESADKGKGGKTGEAIAEGGVTKADAEAAVKEMEQTARDRKEVSGKKKGKKVSNAEIGYVFREVMSNIDKGAKDVVAQTFSRDVVETELAKSGFRGDMRKAADAVTKFISGDTGRNVMKAIEGNEAMRKVALEFMEAVDIARDAYYSRASEVVKRASRDFVKPETTKAQKGAEEATEGIDDRAEVSDEDVEIVMSGMPESTVDGKEVSIEDVKVGEDGGITYTVKDAEGNVSEVSEGDIQIGENDADTARLTESAKELGRNADVMLKAYNAEQNTDIVEYGRQFKQAVQYGEDGRNLDTMKDSRTFTALTDTQVELAYEVGRGMRMNRSSATRVNAKGTPVGKVDTSAIDMARLTKHQRAAVQTGSRLAKAVGFNIRFVNSVADETGSYQKTDNGLWDPNTLTLTVDVKAGALQAGDTNYAMMHTMGHELTHYIRQFSDASLWGEYQRFVMDHLSEKMTNEALDDRISEYMKNQPDLTRDMALEEIVAEASVEALNNITEADIRQIAQTNPGLLNKIKNFIDRWVKSIKAAIKAAYKDTSTDNDLARDMTDVLDEMSSRWNELLVNAAKNRAEIANSKADTVAEAAINEAMDGAQEHVEGRAMRQARKSNDYSYNSLVSKPDVEVIMVESPGTYDRDTAIDLGMENAEKHADRFDRNGKPMILVNDLGKYVSVGRVALRHGLDDKRVKNQAPIVARLGDILANSIVINDLRPKKQDTRASWVLLGAASDPDGRLIYVRSVVNQSTGHLDDVSAFYSAYGKKEKTSRTLSAERVTDKSIQPSSGYKISIAEMLNGVNGLFDDVISKDVADNLGIKRTQSEFSDRLLHQKRDLSNLSDRELLVRSLETELTPAERDHLERYKTKVDALAEKQRRLDEISGKIVEMKKAGATAKTSEELRKLETNATTLRASINRADEALNKIESAAMIKEVIRRNRAEVKKAATEAAKARADERVKRAVEKERAYSEKVTRKIRENAEKRIEAAKKSGDTKYRNLREWQEKEKYRKQVEQDTKRLYKWLTAPGKQGSVPEFLRKPVGDFIEQLDFSSVTKLKGGADTNRDIDFRNALDNLRAAISNLQSQQTDIDGGAESFYGYIDLPMHFAQRFDENVQAIKKALDVGGNRAATPIERMTAAQMKELSQAMRILSSSITHINEFITDGRGTSAKNLADVTINEMTELKARRKANKALELLNSTFNWKNTTPYYAFQRLGLGGKAIFERLQNGWDKMAFNSAKVIEYARDAFTEKESREWSREISKVKLDNGEEIQMTTAQKMSLYCLQKRPQAQGHLMGGGIRISDIDGKRGTKITQADDYTLTMDDITRITHSLTDRQREVADKLQHFMNTTCSDWGNEISMKRFGFRQMEETNYFPIETDANNRARIDETKDGKTSMFRLLNMSALKPLTPNANNAIVIKDIFNVFSDHASDMAKYNALALPILDFIKWYNHVERSDVRGDDGKANGQIKTRSVQKALEHAFGQDAKGYLTEFIRDLNGEHDGGRNDHIINRMTSLAKTASVGANMRVYLLQITSLPRALFAINAKYLIKGMASIRANGPSAQDEIGILKWKDLGFFSTDISRNVRSMVKQDEGTFEKIRNMQMKPAEWGDKFTANVIYNAVRAEMKDKHPDLRPGSADYKRVVNERVREIIYKTQVVDSTMTRSELMRKKGLMSMFTSFMSEPTLTVNMLNEAVQDAIRLKRGGKLDENDLTPGKKAAKAWTAFLACGVASTLVASVVDAFRDDDEYETWLEKYADAIKNNAIDAINIPSMLPVLADFAEAVEKLIKGQDYAPSTLGSQVLVNLVATVNGMREYFEGKRTLPNVIYSGLKTLSYGSGIGMYNATRDAIAIYNATVANGTTLPKIQSWNDNKEKAAKALYEAAQAQDIETFDKLAARAALYGIEGEDLENEYNKLINADYIAGEIDAAAAKRMIQMYGGKTPYQAQTALDKLDYQATSGEKFSDIEKNYVSGKTAKADAKAALTKYGDMTATEAEDKIKKWDYEKDTGRKYSDISNAYIRGEIKRAEIIKAMTKYGGDSAGEAEKAVLKLDYQIKTERPWSNLMKDYHAGRFTSNQVKKYLMEYDQKSESEADDLVDKYDWAKKNGGSTDGYSKYITVHEAIDSGKGLDTAVEALVAKYTARGDTKKEVLSAIRSSITSKYKPIYLAASASEQARMRKQLLDVYVKLGGNYNTYYKNMTDKWFED